VVNQPSNAALNGSYFSLCGAGGTFSTQATTGGAVPYFQVDLGIRLLTRVTDVQLWTAADFADLLSPVAVYVTNGSSVGAAASPCFAPPPSDRRVASLQGRCDPALGPNVGRFLTVMLKPPNTASPAASGGVLRLCSIIVLGSQVARPPWISPPPPLPPPTPSPTPLVAQAVPLPWRGSLGAIVGGLAALALCAAGAGRRYARERLRRAAAARAKRASARAEAEAARDPLEVRRAALEAETRRQEARLLADIKAAVERREREQQEGMSIVEVVAIGNHEAEGWVARTQFW
jgi:hypothetical protein